MSVLAASVMVTNGSKEVVKVPYNHYLVQFQEAQKQVKALLNSGSKIYAMNPAFTRKLGFHI